MSRWCVSVDLGQTIDPTAVCVIEITSRREAVDLDCAGLPGPRVPMSWLRVPPQGDGGLKEPWAPARIDVRHLERLPLRTSYPDQVAHVAKILGRAPLPPGTPLVLDQTGVGRPVVEIFRLAGLNPVGITITAGDGDSQASHDPEEWRVAKLLLVSQLQAALHAGVLRIARDLPEAVTLARELSEFRAQFTPTGYARFGAREGAHDDLVLALALGIWWASRPPSVATFGSYRLSW